MVNRSLAILISVSFLPAIACGKAQPDQVLVVYNADWTADQP